MKFSSRSLINTPDREPTIKFPSLNASADIRVNSEHYKSTHIPSRSRLSTLLTEKARNDIASQARGNAREFESRSKRNVILGLSLMLTSGVLYSLLATLVRWGNKLGYSPAEILMYRASVQMIVAALSYYAQHRRMQKSVNVPAKFVRNQMAKMLGWRQILAVLGRGIFGAGSTFTYFEGSTLIDVGDCVTLEALAAVFTSMAGFCLLGDPITIKHGLSLVLAMVACVLITQPPIVFDLIDGGKGQGSFESNLPGYIVSTASSLFQSGVYICIKVYVASKTLFSE